MALLVTVPVGHLIGYLPATLRHVRDATWSDHARFHMFQDLLLICGWDVAAVLLALGPVRRRERWALGMSAGYLAWVQLGYFVSTAAVPKGRPLSRADNELYRIAMIMYAVGLALAWREPRGESRPRFLGRQERP
jgi:ethanolamine transporter EutH